MTYNYLCTNDSKTEILPIIPKSASGIIIAGLHVSVGSDDVSASECVRNLGVYLDLILTAQVCCTVSTCSLHLRNISQIHCYLPQPTA